MEDDYSAPRSVKDRIALLQKSTSSPSSSTSLPSSSTPARIPSTGISNLYKPAKNSNESPVKSSATSAQSNYNARPESPTSSRAPSPSPAQYSRGESTLQETLASQLVGAAAAGGGGRSSRNGNVKFTESPRAQSPVPPAPPPRLPRRTGSPIVNDPLSAQTQQPLRNRSLTVDPSSSSNPPKLPPRQPQSLTSSGHSSHVQVQLPATRLFLPSGTSSSSSKSSISSNQNLPLSNGADSRSLSTSSFSSQQAQLSCQPQLELEEEGGGARRAAQPQAPPALPVRKPTLPSSNSSSSTFSPRTPRSSNFDPPPPPPTLRPRPVISSKPTLNDPLSSSSSSSSRSKNGSSSHHSASSHPNSQTRSDLTTTTTTTTSQNHLFKIRPIDPRARKRYEQLFYQCLSSSPSSHDSDNNKFTDRGERERERDSEEKLEGELVRMIWERSRLPRDVLREVWNEISPNSGSLEVEGFVRGMWLIDEELRRRQRRD
ncbi:uncharacterized protein JCM6883_002073 [Sporobolomyces salmoneus]|uniref:uncharacterized protein n=1 Tax=Sporobolomyces salmoneus TaxID=183962 RepID=UPI00317EA3F4